MNETIAALINEVKKVKVRLGNGNWKYISKRKAAKLANIIDLDDYSFKVANDELEITYTPSL